MSVGPLRRLVGTLGLVALAPTALLLALGQLSPEDAAIRAGITFAVAVVAGRVADWWLQGLAMRFERARAQEPDGEPVEAAAADRRRGDGEPAEEIPRRRRTDAQPV